MPVASEVEDYLVGSTPIDRLYAGDTEIWPLGAKWPTGLIVHHPGSVAPEGWALCDGSLHGSPALELLLGNAATPDLRDLFVRASTGGAGGADSVTLVEANLGPHSHVISPEQTAHTHSGTSGAMSANAAHSHSVSLGGQSQSHYHHIPAFNTSTVSVWHSHSQIIFNEGDGDSGEGNWVDQNPTSQGATRNVGITGNPSANHTHTFGASNTGTVSAWHQHEAHTSYSDPAHEHSFDTNNTGTHSHTIPAQGGGAAMPTVPAHYVLTYIIRL